MSPLFALVALVSSPAGAWTGKFLPKVPILPPNAPTGQKTKLAHDLRLIETGRLHLTLRPDHTYTMRIAGLPMLGAPNSSGTWSQAGGFVDMRQTGAPQGVPSLHLAYTDKRMSLVQGNSRFEFTR